MKIVCIYHSIDLDGWMSAAVVKHWWNNMPEIKSSDDTITFIGYNYGEPSPNLSEYSKVIMCDISFPKNEMEKIANSGIGVSNFIWIDHHISAIKDMSETHFAKTANGLRNTKYAACELTWQYFFPNDTMPEIVRLLGRYDCFGHKGTDEERIVLEFQYGARQCITSYEDAYLHLVYNIRNDLADTLELDYKTSIWKNGKTIYAYLCTDAKQSYKNGFTIHFDEIVLDDNGFPNCRQRQKFICINKERFNPINFGINYHADGYDGAACFHYADGKWKFSIYNDDGVADCSIIAKQFGGGGHKGAAGFIVDNDTFYKIINNV